MRLALLAFLLLPAFSVAQSSPVQAAAPSPGQPGEGARFAQPVPMQPARTNDSYIIYSQLLKSGPIEWRDVSRKHWLVEDTTSAVPLDVACQPGAGGNSMSVNPYSAVQAPADRKTEWKEVLADYDQHCHDVVRLDQTSFRTALPVRLLGSTEKKSFQQNSRQPPAEFAEGAGLHRFSEVFFNTDHTLALVEQGMWCGALCGNWTWVVLERKDDQWKVLPWVHTFTVS